MCEHAEDPDVAKQELTEVLTAMATSRADKETAPAALEILSVDDFIAIEEDGASALLGTDDAALIPEDSDVVVYGDGGAGKTTLTVDGAFHLAAGDDWLDIPVQRQARVLLIENEGPAVQFRAKLKRKREAWKGSPLGDRLSVFNAPWGDATFADEGWRSALANKINEDQIEVVIGGPVVRLGMDEAGTLQQVREFLTMVKDVRAKAGRRLTVILVHHTNKNGTVSGAWEWSGDSLLFVSEAGNGHTNVHIQKARWSSTHHNTKIKLAWTDGEGYMIEDERNYVAEIQVLLLDEKPRTTEGIGKPKHEGGIGASRSKVKEALDRGDCFRSLTAKS